MLGHDVWRGAFASAPDIVGRQVRVGGEPHTVVGVMPEGFAFPISESFWVPFQLTSSSYPPLEGPPVRAFGRLAPDANLEGAQVELTTVTQRVVLGNPETHQQLRAQVLLFPNEVMDISSSVSVGLMSSNGLFILFLILMAANVALLVFVRAATREREILVRVALGADRGRVVAQLFAETLVLGLVGAFVGLLATGISIRWAFRTFESLDGQLPFWFGPSLSLTTVAYALGLTALGALVAGALPGLKITEGNLESRLRQSNTGLPSTGVSRLWSGIIVVQVAISALAVPIAYTVFTQMLEKRGDAHLFASRLRTLAESVDPALRLDEILPLDQVGGSLMLELALTSTIVAGVGALAILLSLAGIYSVMAFRIERRTREIGLRAALGADKLRIIIPMLRPVFIQVGLGISFAVGIIFLLGVAQSARGAAIVATFAVFTLVISILACAVPIRRALRVEPTEALRAGN